MELKLSNRCNNSCKVCDHLGKLAPEELTTEAAVRAIKSMRKISDVFELTGGEPLLRKDILSLLKLAEQLRFRRKILHTNARLLANYSLAKVVASFDFQILVPFFSRNPEEHDRVTSTRNSFVEALLGISNFRTLGGRTIVNLFITEENIKDLTKTIDYFSKLGVKGFRLTILTELYKLFKQIKKAWDYCQTKKVEIDFENYKRELSILLNHMVTGPIVTQFEITNKCNHQCVFCYHHSPHLLEPEDDYFKTHSYNKELVKRSKEWHNKKLEFSLLKRYVREAAQLGCNYIQLGGGGEPTTHPELMNMIRYIKGLDLKVQIFTNFTLPTPRMISEMVKLKVDVIEINVSAAHASTYCKIHTVGESEFKRLLANLELINELKEKNNVKLPELRIMNPICSFNYREIVDMVEFANLHCASAVYFAHLQTTPLTDYLLLNKTQVKLANKLVREALKKAKHYNLKNNFEQFLDILNYKGSVEGSHTKEIYNRVGCLIPFYETQIHLDGTVAPCCLHPPIFSIGNMDFSELWNSDAYRKHRAKVLLLYQHKEKPYLCRGCRMCVYQQDLQRFYNNLEKQKLAKFLK